MVPKFFVYLIMYSYPFPVQNPHPTLEFYGIETKDFLNPLEFAFETLFEMTESSCIALAIPDLIIEYIGLS